MKSNTVKIIMMFLCVIIVILLCVISFMAGKIGKQSVNSDVVESTIDYEVSSITFNNIFFKYPTNWYKLEDEGSNYIYFRDTEADIPDWKEGENIHVQMKDDKKTLEDYVKGDFIISQKSYYKEFEVEEYTLQNGIEYKKIVAVLKDNKIPFEIHYTFMISNELYLFSITSDAEISKDTDVKVYNMINSIQYK